MVILSFEILVCVDCNMKNICNVITLFHILINVLESIRDKGYKRLYNIRGIFYDFAYFPTILTT
jgi:hypothetical protein